MAAKTLHGKCPRCCPDGGACFSRGFDGDKWVKKCNNCHLVLPLRTVKKPTGPNGRQVEILERLREMGWTITKTELIGRRVWLAADNPYRSMWTGNSLYGTIGPNGKIDLTLQRIGGDRKIRDAYWDMRELCPPNPDRPELWKEVSHG